MASPYSFGYEPLARGEELLTTTNRDTVDGWTAVHALFGVAAAAIGLPWWIAIGGAVVYEVIEHKVESNPDNIFGTSGPEVMSNVVTDVVVFALAYAATKPRG